MLLILLMLQLLSIPPTFSTEEADYQITLKIDKTDSLAVGEIFRLTIKNIDKQAANTSIHLASNLTINTSSAIHSQSHILSFDSETNKLTIDWIDDAKSWDLSIDITVVAEGHVELFATYNDVEDTIASNIISIEANAEPIKTPVAGELQEVGTWSGLEEALSNDEVKEISIINDFTRTVGNINVNGDKIIHGNDKVIDFAECSINIGEFNVTVENLVLQTNQAVGVAESSVFYSNDSNAMLHLKDTSFDSVQHGQVAHLLHGQIRISGEVEFQTSGAFEVFEARDITFEADSTFIGATTGNLADGRKEVINLYHTPTVIVEENAQVTLHTFSNLSILNFADESLATIELSDNSKLSIYTDDLITSYGEALINFSGDHSRIFMAQDAIFDIQNHRRGAHNGGLLKMDGTLFMNSLGSKVELWDRDANIDNQSGNGYTYFPKIIDGVLTLSPSGDGMIETGHAAEHSTRSISDNEANHEKTFLDLFSNKATSDIKRLFISSADKLEKPEMDQIVDKDDMINVQAVGAILEIIIPEEEMRFETTSLGFEEGLIPRENPDWSLKVRDTRGQGSEWKLTAKADAPWTSVDGHESNAVELVFREGESEQSLAEEVLIENGTTGDQEETTIQWAADQGIFLSINPLVDELLPNVEYTTEITWSLVNAP